MGTIYTWTLKTVQFSAYIMRNGEPMRQRLRNSLEQAKKDAEWLEMELKPGEKVGVCRKTETITDVYEEVE